MTTRRTGRWWFATAGALLAGGAGAVTARPIPVALASVPVLYLVYARLFALEAVDLAVERSIAPTDPEPGDHVEVTVTVRNEGARPLADVRVVDGVPDAIEVVDGSPRFGTALRAGETQRFSYAVEAVRGQHGFEAATVAVRDVSGAVERELTVGPETVLTAVPPLSTVPSADVTSAYTGDELTDSGGSGLSFHSVRQHRHGDPMNRVEWNRLARTGDLSTVRYREERAAQVVLVVDVRPEAYWSHAAEERHAVERSVSAAGQLFTALQAAGDRVGVTTIGPETCWLPPGAGRDHAVRAQRLLATHEAFSYRPPESGRTRRELSIEPTHESVDVAALRARVPTDTQLVLFSPLCDDALVDAVGHLEEAGYPVTVVSPDPTGDGSRGERLAALQRTNRIRSLWSDGVTVYDWGPEASLATTLERDGRDRS